MATTVYPVWGGSVTGYLPTPNLVSLYAGGNLPGLDSTRGVSVVSSSKATGGSGATVTVNEFMSQPLAANVTISGTVTFNVRIAESNMSANIGAKVEVLRVTAETLQLTSILSSAKGTEASITTEAAQNWTGTPTSTDFKKGDRILIRLQFSDAGGTQGTGYSGTIWIAGTTGGASGDTYITFTETIGFLTTTNVITVVYFRDLASGVVGGSDDNRAMSTTAGPGILLATTPSIGAGPVSSVQVQRSGTNVRWYTPPMNATTLVAPLSLNLTGRDSVGDVDSGLVAKIIKRTAAGSETDVGWMVSPHLTASGLQAGTSTTNWGTKVGVQDISIASGDRLGVIIYGDDYIGGAKASSSTVSFTYDRDGFDGGSFLSLNASATVTFQEETTSSLPPRFRAYLQAVNRASSY